MSMFSRIKDFFNNMDRSVLLGLGLVVIAGLVAATFVLGDTEQVADQSDTETAEQQEETQEPGQTGGTENETADESNGDPDSEEQAETRSEEGAASGVESEQAPEQLADTGPISAIAAAALGAGGYVYHRSRSNLRHRRKE